MAAVDGQPDGAGASLTSLTRRYDRSCPRGAALAVESCAGASAPLDDPRQQRPLRMVSLACRAGLGTVRCGCRGCVTTPGKCELLALLVAAGSIVGDRLSGD